MKNKNLSEIAIVFFTTFVLFIVFNIYFIAIVHVVNIHEDVFFVRYMQDSLIFILILVVLYILYKLFFKVQILQSNIFIYSICYFLLCTYLFNITFPTTIDRSYSVYMLAALAEFPEKLDSREKLHSFLPKHVSSQANVERRIHEQEVIGNITINDGKITLTNSGQSFYEVHKFLGNLFNVDVCNYNPQKCFSHN